MAGDRIWQRHTTTPFTCTCQSSLQRKPSDLEECLVNAGDAVMDDPDFRLRVDSGIETYPHHYVDPDGAALWKIVSEFFSWKDADTFSERVDPIEEEVTV